MVFPVNPYLTTLLTSLNVSIPQTRSVYDFQNIVYYKHLESLKLKGQKSSYVRVKLPEILSEKISSINIYLVDDYKIACDSSKIDGY
jgi:hypothetical protein